MNTVCLVLCLASPLCAREARPPFYRVEDNIYRGKQPTKEEIPELAGLGIKTVLDLREVWGRKSWERGAVEAAGMNYIRIGLPGTFPPTDKQIDKILAVLEDPTKGPVFIHCRRGKDRTGLVIACYRIAHDHWTNTQALKAARKEGLNRFQILMQRYIMHFHAPEPSAGTVKMRAVPAADPSSRSNPIAFRRSASVLLLANG
jgi:tyrosine-protein phosphatase SIW14